jgi:hypothetical protein
VARSAFAAVAGAVAPATATAVASPKNFRLLVSNGSAPCRDRFAPQRSDGKSWSVVAGASKIIVKRHG